MGVDITIGERIPAKVAPLFPCGISGCLGAKCRQCVQEVRQEEQPESPPHTIYGKTGGFNYDALSYGQYDRWLRETGIAGQFPALDYGDYPSVIAIPDGLGAALHQLATDIELGIITTQYPTVDAEFACWMAWWCIYAVRTYGDRAAILFH